MVILLLACVSGPAGTGFLGAGELPSDTVDLPDDTGVDGPPRVGTHGVRPGGSEWSVEADVPSLEELAAVAAERGTGEGVVIIGGGPAGLAAAALVGEGAILLEADPQLGGRGRLSGAFVFLPDAPEVEAEGLGYDATQLLADWEGLTGSPPTVATSMFLGDARATHDWMAAQGMVFETGHQDPVYARYLQLQVEGGGEAMVAAQVAGLPRGVEVRLGVPATGLEFDGDRVVGVRTAGGVVPATQVVIATGGFVRRADLIERFIGTPPGTWGPSTDDGGRGAAVVWAERYGFLVGAPDAIGWNANVTGIASPAGTPVGLARSGPPPWVWVDVTGQRFIDESAGWSLTLAAQVARRSNVWGIVAWDTLLGAVASSNVTALEDARAVGESVRCADDPVALAASLGLPFAAFEATLDEVEAARQAGGMDGFGRAASGLPVLTGELCGVRTGRIAAKNYGGLQTDLDGRVLDLDGEVVPGLWATGEAAGMGMPGLGGQFGFDGSLGAVVWSGLRVGAAVSVEPAPRAE